MTTLKILFWLCLFIVFYTYLGYGMVLYAVLKLRNLLFGKPAKPSLPDDESLLPHLTLMICAYNEEDVVEEKMQNIRQLDYPREKLTVMWVTDGSTDSTNELLGAYPEVELVYSPERRGKAVAMQHGLEKNTAPIVVFTDANTMLNSGALLEIARCMQDERVGCVAGEKRVASKGDGAVASEGEGLYWRYESTLKRWDSELFSAMGAAGELFAVRMSDYKAAPQNALLDDFMISMLMLKAGKRIAYTADAYATEYGSANMHEESKRKRRIAAGGLQSTWWLRSLMNPLRHPVVAFQFTGHRVLRWTVSPFCMMLLIPLNVALVMMSAGWIYTAIWLMQIAFYLAAAAGWWLSSKGRHAGPLYIPYYFMFMNLNVFEGIAYLRTHKSSGAWERAARA